MKICLISMPWQSLESPSLPIGLLGSKVRSNRAGDTVDEVHASLRWADHLLAATHGALNPRNYTNVADNGLFDGLGDWVFSADLYDREGFAEQELAAYVARWNLESQIVDEVHQMRPHVESFLDALTQEIVAERYDLVGFTSTFMQNVPSLALAKRLKLADPRIRIVMGGGNCDGPMGAALHRNHPFLDFVVRGEGEVVFLQLLSAIDGDAELSTVPGLCWWEAPHVPRANDENRSPLPPAAIPAPDFDRWFEAFDTSDTRGYMDPKLIYEGARGCWWGEKHQCTFCGLNGSLIEFRVKSASVIWDELSALIKRHKVLDVIMVDNILDMSFLKSLLPRMAETGWDLRVHYEVKSNLKREHMEILAAARVAHIQPGIESLNNDVLRLMDKGTTGGQNIRTIRNGESHSLTVSWNYLYGFPGESAEHYNTVISQFPRLVHLRAPIGISRIALERFSPHFEQPELGFPKRSPASMYQHVYALPQNELADMVYLFDTPAQGITGNVEQRLSAAAERWKTDYENSSLVMHDLEGDRLEIRDRRMGWIPADHELDAWRAHAYRLLEKPHGPNAVYEHLQVSYPSLHRKEFDEYVQWLDETGLVFDDGDSIVALATTAVPTRVPDLNVMA